jgi:hypothetical protein
MEKTCKGPLSASVGFACGEEVERFVDDIRFDRDGEV